MNSGSERCPQGLCGEVSDSTYGQRACDRSERLGCSSIHYYVSGYYFKICGRVQGFQRGTMDAFHPSPGKTIKLNDPYVDGIDVSIIRGNPRQHVRTYAVGDSETDNANVYR